MTGFVTVTATSVSERVASGDDVREMFELGKDKEILDAIHSREFTRASLGG
jgi:hypothetical protein